jgi:proline iminopeptidase
MQLTVQRQAERGDLMAAFYARLTGTDEAAKLAAAKAWTTWEMATSKLIVDPATVERGGAAIVSAYYVFVCL